MAAYRSLLIHSAVDNERALGLCASCAHARRIDGARSSFVMCGLSKDDPRFAKYPRLPVRVCKGYLARERRPFPGE
jgi:hypothetical protein